MGFSLEPLLRRFFYWYGGFTYRFRWFLFLFPLAITPLLGIGLIWYDDLRVDDPAFVFTPKDARWKHEFGTFAKLWPLTDNEFLPGKSFEMKRFVNILCKSADGGNIFRPHILDEIERLNQHIIQNITVPTDDGKYNLTYQDLCLGYEWNCGANEHIRMFKEMSRLGRVIDLSFPRGGNKDTPVYLGSAIGDIVLNETDSTVLEAKITQLFYFLKQSPDLIRDYSTAFEYKAEHFLLHEFKSDIITYSFAHYQSLEDGLDENAKRFFPNFVTSFTTLSLFCLACAFVLKQHGPGGGRFNLDWVRSKPMVACCGLLNTLISLVSGFGFMMLLGIPYNVINTIIPFLIITIGIDDMFIMNACWDQTDRKLPIEERMRLMMMHAGVAVSITNITDILSFAIGCYTELPGIEYFCMYACSSVFFCYIYQMTYFAGFMAIMGICEGENRHCLLFHQIEQDKVQPVDFHMAEAGPIEKKEEMGMVTIKINTNVEAEPLPPKIEPHHERHETHANNAVHKFFSNKYAPFIMRHDVRALVCCLYVVYAIGAFYGCANFREGLEPSHLVTDDHYIAKYFEDMKLFWQVGPQLHVVIQEPPDLIDPLEREKLMAVVRAFEDTEYTMGSEGTVFFFLEYLNYLDQLNAELENTDHIWKKKLQSWLKFTGASNQWKADIVYDDDGGFKAYRFQIALKNIVEPNQHKIAATMLRRIADEQPYNVAVYHEAFPFADQYIIILPSTIRNVGISLCCMAVIALLLIPSFPSAVFIMVSIVSICLGVFGYMTIWGVNLDAVSMISLIMSIGFAVDLSAHIVYAFVTSKGESIERVKGALAHLGWPILQGASSTIMGISILYTVDAYIILTFFKTIWLTMFIGAVHGLIFIPTLLSIIPVRVFQIHESAH
uniref:SSD domain-containing protein n=1 Tax=Panagrellus redivivus TaxID=6233 RepID=A0A7E4WBE9_PANRE